MNRRLRYTICYIAMGLVAPSASRKVKERGYRSAISEGFDPEDHEAGYNASVRNPDQAALTALCNAILDAEDAGWPEG